MPKLDFKPENLRSLQQDRNLEGDESPIVESPRLNSKWPFLAKSPQRVEPFKPDNPLNGYPPA